MVNRSPIRVLLACSLAVSVSNWFVVSSARAATNDMAFNDCIQDLETNPSVSGDVSWHTSPLDPKLRRLEGAQLWGDHIVRWMVHRNQNGSRTIIIMTRAPDDVLADDPDSFDFYMQRGRTFTYVDAVSSSAVAISKHSNDGVSGLWVCTKDRIYNEWFWIGDDWK